VSYSGRGSGQHRHRPAALRARRLRRLRAADRAEVRLLDDGSGPDGSGWYGSAPGTFPLPPAEDWPELDLPPARRHWPVALGAAAAVLALTGGAILLAPARHAGPVDICPAQWSCGPATASPSGPSGVAGVSTVTVSVSVTVRPRPRPRPSPRPSTSSPTPTPTAAPRPAPKPAPPPVQVSYALVHQWPRGFQGEFTIVNHSAETISGWQLAAALPGDHVWSVWNANFRTLGDTLVMYAPPYQLTIPPGGSVSEHFTASGPTISPAGCTFNGAPC